MSYVVEAGASRSRRARQRRALITLAIVALMLFFAFWYAYSYYKDSDKATAAPTTTCTTAATTASALVPAQVTVNVYNATERNGLAAKTAAEVRKRGFKVATVSNDPLNRNVTTGAEVRFGSKGAASSKLVLALVKGSKAVKDKRTDATVDLVLGDRFTALAAPAKPAVAASSATGGC